ncbi:MAG: hypothetical protein WC070_04000 [Candidatus Magasanikbacteria bacterium]
MNDVLKFGKKLFTFSVVAMTMVWSVGLAALAPVVAHAEGECPTVEAGDLVKVAGKASVYVISSDLKRQVIPNESVFYTWYKDFSGVVTIPETCLAQFPLASRMLTFREGSMLVKSAEAARVFAILPGGELSHILSEQVAISLYGSNWNQSAVLRTLPDTELMSYIETSKQISTATLHEGMLVKKSGTTDVYSVMSGKLYKVSGTLSKVTAPAVRTVSAEVFASVEMSTASVTESAILMQTAPSTETPNQAGTLTLSLSANTPSSMNLPKDILGQTYVTMVAKAGDKAVDLTGLTVERAGLGRYDDFDKVYVVVDGITHGSKRVLGSDDEVEIYFSTDSNKITIPANSSVSISIVADMNGTLADSGNSSYLRIASVETTAKVNATFPISGNAMTVSGVSAPSITFDYSGNTSDLIVGETDKTVAEFSFDASTTEDVKLYSVLLKQKGTASTSDVVDYTLYYGDEVVAGPVQLGSNDYVKFVLSSPMLLEQDEINYDFTVKADVVSGNGETVKLVLDERTDVVAKGTKNGFLTVPTDVDASNEVTHTIKGGALSIDEHSDNPKAGTYAPKTKDIVMLVAELDASDETVVVTELPISITASAGTLHTTAGDLDLENLRVKLDGKTVCGPVDVTSATITCDEEFEVKGKQKLVVTADFAETVDSNDAFVFSIVSSGNAVKIEDLSGDALYSTGTTYDVSGSATGKAMTASSGTLSVSKNTSYANRTITTGASDYKLASFVIKAPTSQDVTIKKYTVTVGGAYGVANISDLHVSGDTDVIKDPAASNNFTVSTLLSKENTLTLDVYGSLDSSTTGAVTTTLAVEFKGSSDGITTTTSAVTGQTVTVAAGGLTDSLASANPDADIVLSEAKNVKVYSLQFEPSYDTFTLTDLDLTMSNSAAVTAVRIGNKEVTQFFSGVANFDGLTIDLSKKTTVDVYADFALVDSDLGIASGVTTTFEMTGYEASATQGDDVVDTSTSAGASNVFELRAARPVLAYTAGAEAAQKGFLSIGDNEMIKLTITADGGTVDFKGITLDLVQTGVTTTYVELLDSTRSSLATTTVSDATDAGGWDLSGLADSDREIGTTGVYYLSVKTSAVDASAQIAMKVTGITWDDDETTSSITGTYVDVLPSAKFLATENN